MPGVGKVLPTYGFRLRRFDLMTIGKTLAVVWRDQTRIEGPASEAGLRVSPEAFNGTLNSH